MIANTSIERIPEVFPFSRIRSGTNRKYPNTAPDKRAQIEKLIGVNLPRLTEIQAKQTDTAMQTKSVKYFLFRSAKPSFTGASVAFESVVESTSLLARYSSKIILASLTPKNEAG